MNVQIYRLIRLILYLLPIFVIVMLVWKEINPSGIRTFEYTLDNFDATISPLFPANRLAGIEGDQQLVKESPVYFTVNYPHRYDSASIVFLVHNPNAIAWKVGLDVEGPDQWSYELQSYEEGKPFEFDLSQARISDRHLRFLLDAGTNNEFYIRSIRITLERDPINIAFLKNKFLTFDE